MPENNFKIRILKRLIHNVEYNSASGSLLVKCNESLSPEEMDSLVREAVFYNIESNHAQDIIRTLINDIHNLRSFRSSKMLFSINFDSCIDGKIFYIELADNSEGITNRYRLELMKISRGKCLILDSSEKGLLPGDIFTLHNSILATDSQLIGSVKGSEEYGEYRSARVTAIREYKPSLLHRAIDEDYANIIGHSNTIYSCRVVDVTHPLMGVLMQEFYPESLVRLHISGDNALDTIGKKYLISENGNHWISKV